MALDKSKMKAMRGPEEEPDAEDPTEGAEEGEDYTPSPEHLAAANRLIAAIGQKNARGVCAALADLDKDEA